MVVPTSVFALPASLLLLIARAPVRVASQELEWPYNLPPHIKYYPQDEALVKREISLQQKLQQQPAVGVKKMSTNPDEKFYLDYWTFGPETDDHNFNSWTNASLHELQPCTPLHNNKTLPKAPRNIPFSLWTRSPFDKGDFQCPSGTNACTAIGYPNSCCPTGETCQIVQDTGLGNVGCCPAGSTCAGSLSSCSAGQTGCPSDQGGGCCIAGYGCFEEGCVYTGTATVLVTPSPISTLIPSTTTLTITTVITPSVSSALPTTVTSTTVIVTEPLPSSTFTSTSKVIIVPTSSSRTTVTSTIHTTVSNEGYTCSPGYKSCPASLGGGCCSTDRGCGAEFCPALSSTNTPYPPVRGTTDTTTTTAAPTTIPGAGCPTGFYACSAYYQGGCCQVGRDCAKTNCPTSASTTLVSGSVATIVAPTGSGISTAILSGVCATGWRSCLSSNGGGCCPIGYSCGMDCTATASGGGGNVVGKEPPESNAMSVKRFGSMRWVALLAGFISIMVL
jgi:progranulin